MVIYLIKDPDGVLLYVGRTIRSAHKRIREHQAEGRYLEGTFQAWELMEGYELADAEAMMIQALQPVDNVQRPPGISYGGCLCCFMPDCQVEAVSDAVDAWAEHVQRFRERAIWHDREGNLHHGGR